MRILLSALLLGLAIARANQDSTGQFSSLLYPKHSSNIHDRLLIQNYPMNLQAQMPLQSSNSQAGSVSGFNPMKALPDNIQLQKMMDHYNQIQMANQHEDAEADGFNEAMPLSHISQANRGLRTKIISKRNRKRYLAGNENEGGAEGEKKEDEDKKEDEEKKSDSSDDKKETSEDHQESGSDKEGDDKGDDKGDSKDETDSYLERLLKRTNSINDKIDHLLFHNHHDLAGVTGHFTPNGVVILPSNKGENSVDQKLKMIDYMHNLGGGYNPMLHTMLPYYLGHNNSSVPGIKMNGFLGVDGSNVNSKRRLI